VLSGKVHVLVFYTLSIIEVWCICICFSC